MENWQIFVWIIVGINVFSFIIFGLDKLLAVRQWRRVPESTLLLLAVFGGALGELLAMLIFRHKTLHKKFAIGLPLILIIQIGLAVYFGLIA